MVRHRRQWVEQRSLQKLLVGGSVEVKKNSLLILYILYILRYYFIILLTHLEVMIICYDMLCLFFKHSTYINGAPPFLTTWSSPQFSWHILSNSRLAVAGLGGATGWQVHFSA